MKRMEKMFILMAAVLCIMFVMPVSAQAATQTVKLDKKVLTVYKGGSAALKMTGTAKKLVWSSSNKSVATVSSKGVVTAKKVGKAVITVKSGKNKATCKVTVKKTLSAKQAVAKFNSQVKNIKNITLKAYQGSVSPANHLLTLAMGVKSKVTYIEVPSDSPYKVYYRGKKVYWFDNTDKQWHYYTNSEDVSSEIRFNPSGMMITKDMKYKNVGIKNFDGRKCQALKITDEENVLFYYLDLADYSLAGISGGKGSDKSIVLVDTKTTVSIPSSIAKNATYKEPFN